MPMDEGGSKSSNDITSAGDLAWADTCLVKLSEASDSDWSSFEASLLETLNGPTEPITFFTDEDGDFNDADFGDYLPFPSGETSKAPMSDSSNSDEEDSQDEEEDDDYEGTTYKKKKKWLKGQIDESPLLPGHAEFPKAEITDSEFDFGSTSFEDETSSSQEIFRVWDLGVSEELDEFTEKLNEALGGNAVASNSYVTELQPDFGIQPVDDLIAGISELSLGHSSV